MCESTKEQKGDQDIFPKFFLIRSISQSLPNFDLTKIQFIQIKNYSIMKIELA